MLPELLCALCSTWAEFFSRLFCSIILIKMWEETCDFVFYLWTYMEVSWVQTLHSWNYHLYSTFSWTLNSSDTVTVVMWNLLIMSWFVIFLSVCSLFQNTLSECFLQDWVPTVDFLNIFPQIWQAYAGKLPWARQYNMTHTMYHTQLFSHFSWSLYNITVHTVTKYTMEK